MLKNGLNFIGDCYVTILNSSEVSDESSHVFQVVCGFKYAGGALAAVLKPEKIEGEIQRAFEEVLGSEMTRFSELVEEEEPMVLIDLAFFPHHTEEEIRAMVYHELAHIVLEHINNPEEGLEIEVAADLYAAEFVGKRVVASCLKKSFEVISGLFEKETGKKVPDEARETMRARLAALED